MKVQSECSLAEYHQLMLRRIKGGVRQLLWEIEALEESMATFTDGEKKSAAARLGREADVVPQQPCKGKEATRRDLVTSHLDEYGSGYYKRHPMASVAYGSRNGRSSRAASLEKLDATSAEEHEPSVVDNNMESDPISQVSDMMEKEKETESNWDRVGGQKPLNNGPSVKRMTDSAVDDMETYPIGQVSVMEQEKAKELNWVNVEGGKPLNNGASVKSITELVECGDKWEEGFQSVASYSSSSSSLDTAQVVDSA